MYNTPDILALAYKQPIMHDQMVTLHEKEQQIPGSVQYSIRRYHKHPQWNMEDTGMLVYHFKQNDPKENYLELRFCISGNAYCREKEVECNACKVNNTRNCSERMDTVDVLSFRFMPVHLLQFMKPRRPQETLTDEILEFTH